MTPRAWRFLAFVLGGLAWMAALLVWATGDYAWCSGGFDDACVAPDRPLHRTGFVVLVAIGVIGFATMVVAAAVEARVRRRTPPGPGGAESPRPHP